MTPSDDNDSVNARLNDLYADYRRQLPARISYIAEQLAAYCAQPTPPGTLLNLHHALHKLAGSGATFGHPEIGRIARQWEHLTGTLLSSETLTSPEKQQEMHALLAQLSRAAAFSTES